MQIQANELRIGNYYKWYAEGKYYEYQVDAIDLIQNYQNFEPIPITEEWLLKFGFINKDKYGYFSLYYNELTSYYLLYKVGNTHIEMCLNEYTTAQCHIQYVHQLQNLYFALTQTELTLKDA